MRARRSGHADAPLLEWGEALRAHRRRRSRRARAMLATGVGLSILLATLAVPPVPRLLWNASASAPIGLYVVNPGAIPEPGDMVVARVPESFRRLAATRRYLPKNVPLVKRVAARAGDRICAFGNDIFVEGRWHARRRAADSYGRTLPAWLGCHTLRDRQLLLLMDDPASFDGRYFGPTESADIIGTARIVWRD